MKDVIANSAQFSQQQTGDIYLLWRPTESVPISRDRSETLRHQRATCRDSDDQLSTQSAQRK